jgi:hypothetical protein
MQFISNLENLRYVIQTFSNFYSNFWNVDSNSFCTVEWRKKTFYNTCARHLQNTLPSAHIDNMSRGAFHASRATLNANASEHDVPPQCMPKSPRNSWTSRFQSWVSRLSRVRRSLMNLCQAKSGTWTGQPPTEQEQKAARLLQATPFPHHLPTSPSLK